MGNISTFLFLFAILRPTWSHLCLVFPEQRGSMDITKSGSSTCFRHGAECGGQPPETPGVTPYMGGSQMWVKIQQNFNHYEVGYPGYMDIAVAPLNSTDFQTLAYTPDYYMYAQDHQENFTTIVILPNIDCDHCVIRARYNPHKPGETTFYQCADIKIKKSNGPIFRNNMVSLPPLSQNLDSQYRTVKKKFSFLKYKNRDGPRIDHAYLVGLSYSNFEKSVLNMVNISLVTGYPFAVNQYDLNIAMLKRHQHRRENQYIAGGPVINNYMYDAIGAINTKGNLVTFVHVGEPDDVSDMFVEFDLHIEGKIVESSTITGIGAPVNAILPYDADKYYTFSIHEGANPGDYVFVVGNLNKQSSGRFAYLPVMKSMPENLYINFQWAEYDPYKNLIYVLMGNENSPDQLKARFYTFNLLNQSYAVTDIDVSEYTFMSMHLDPVSGKLYAVSPGLFPGKNTQWFLIEVDPVTGKSKYVLTIANYGYFAKYYGGSVFNGICRNGVLHHAFRLFDTNADVIAAINIAKKTVTFSEITNLGGVHNLALVTIP